MSYSVRNIAIAGALAIVAAFLVIAYVGKVQNQASSGQATVHVVVARKAVPAGTSVAEAVAGGDFAVHEVVRKDAVAGSFTDTRQLNGQLVLGQPVVAGQQVTGAMLRASQNVAVKAQISGDLRAEQLRLGKDAQLVGTLQAGDHVDLVGVFKVQSGGGGSSDTLARVFARNILVLSTSDSGVSSASLTADSADDASIQLAVPDSVVPKVNVAVTGGTLWLVDRPASNAHDSSGLAGLASIETVLYDGLTQQEKANVVKQLTEGGAR
jgi:pilus assembly protein CpaB